MLSFNTLQLSLYSYGYCRGIELIVPFNLPQIGTATLPRKYKLFPTSGKSCNEIKFCTAAPARRTSSPYRPLRYMAIDGPV